MFSMTCIVTDGFCDFLNLSTNISTKVFALSHLSLECNYNPENKINVYNFCNGNQRDCANLCHKCKIQSEEDVEEGKYTGCRPLQSGLQDYLSLVLFLVPCLMPLSMPKYPTLCTRP